MEGFVELVADGVVGPETLYGGDSEKHQKKQEVVEFAGVPLPDKSHSTNVESHGAECCHYLLYLIVLELLNQPFGLIHQLPDVLIPALGDLVVRLLLGEFDVAGEEQRVQHLVERSLI